MLFKALPFSKRFYELGEHFFSIVQATPLKNPFWLHINIEVMALLGINMDELNTQEGLHIFSGKKPLADQPSLAMVYSGHQFGGYNPRLGDGRAMLLAQINTKHGILDVQLKGAGPTPYSRGSDGRAVLRSSIREYLGSEAMHKLGVATTRALCLIGSEEPVIRETIESGATVTRVAKTHIRFGHFEYFHYTGQQQQVKQLADYVIEQFLPDAVQSDDKYDQLLLMSVSNTAQLIAKWQSIGFAHGVMNTDNMSIIGETLDYGPYGFLDDYEPGFICNHTDQTGRYAFDQQPSIGLWNLSALAHALSSLINKGSSRDILHQYEPILIDTYASLMRKKLGFITEKKDDHTLCSNLLSLMAQDKVDYTRLFRRLCEFTTLDAPAFSEEAAKAVLVNNNPQIGELFTQQDKWKSWAFNYNQRLKAEHSSDTIRSKEMKKTNPKFIARNHLLQKAIEKAEKDKDNSAINTLFMLLQTPFDEHPEFDDLANPPKNHEKHLEISCSS